MIQGKHASVVFHCSVLGRTETPVRTFAVSDVQPFAHYPVSVAVIFQTPRQRRKWAVTMVPNNRTYLTIESAGQVLYDSRGDVPCDMAEWERTNAEWQARRSKRRETMKREANQSTATARMKAMEVFENRDNRNRNYTGSDSQSDLRRSGSCGNV